MKDDERLDAMIRELADGYQRPPATPRDEMWARIQSARALPRHRPASVARPRPRWVTWVVGLAATLAIGIALGRFTARQPAEPATAAAPLGAGTPGENGAPRDGAPAAYRLAATDHLGRVETFLAVFSGEAAAGRLGDADLELPARQLLRRTRLLRGSPAVDDDVALRALLDDVEFVLLQIASFAQVGGERELGFVEQGINERSVLLRLRSALPGAQARQAAEGSL